MNLIHGLIVTFLKNGKTTNLPANVNKDSGMIYPEVIIHINATEFLREEFVSDSGITYMICEDCHEFIITPEMREEGSISMCINCTDGQWY